MSTEADMAELNALYNDAQSTIYNLSLGQPKNLEPLMATLLYNTIKYAVSIVPYDTGTLASAHRGAIEYPGRGQIDGYIYLDPSVTNPRNGARPADYGWEVHESQPWFDWTFQWLEQEVLDGFASDIIDIVLDDMGIY